MDLYTKFLVLPIYMLILCLTLLRKCKLYWNIWIGHKYDSVRYSETISRLYPHIKGCVPYWETLFASIKIYPGEGYGSSLYVKRSKQ